MFWHLWYFLALGIVLGSLISAYLPRRQLSSIAKRSGFRGILIAALLGAISPLGSYAVIPIFTTMLAAGLPRAPMMTFLVASPLINPVIFILTWTVISPSMALARLASAVILGVLCGVLVDRLTRSGYIREVPVQDLPLGLTVQKPASGNPGHKMHPAHASCANPRPPIKLQASTFSEGDLHRSKGERLREALELMWKTAKYPGRYFLIAILLAALVETYVPKEAFARYFGTGHASIVLAALMGIPMYMCGGGAIPLVAQFMNMGMDRGAALAFLVVGPATRIAPMVTVFSLVRKRVFLVYFLVVLLGGIALGFLYGLT